MCLGENMLFCGLLEKYSQKKYCNIYIYIYAIYIHICIDIAYILYISLCTYRVDEI